MKKKIINGFLVAALLMGSASAFVSCKDYEEDNFNTLQERLTTLDKALQQQKSLMESEIARLEQLQRECKENCTNALEAYYTKIQSNDLFLTKTDAANTYLTKTDAASTYLTLSAWNSFLAGYTGTAKQLDDAIAALKNRLDNFNNEGITIEEKIARNNQAILEAKALAETALNLAKNDSIRIDDLVITTNGLRTDLNSTINRLNQIAFAWSDSLKTAYETAALAQAQAAANRTTLDSLLNLWNNLVIPEAYDDTELRTRIDSVVNALNDYATKAELEKVDSAAKENFAIAKHLADSALTRVQQNLDSIGRLDGRVTALELKVADIEDAYQEADSLIWDELNKLGYDVRVLKSQVVSINAKLVMLNLDFQNQITGIIINATENPVIGYLNTPVGVRSTMLAAFYGKAVKGFNFPTAEGRYYIDATEAFTEQDMQVMGITDFAEVEGYNTKAMYEKFVAENNGSTEGNAGKLYLTINPSTANHTGDQLVMESSAERASTIKLSPLVPSNKELSFGYTPGTRSVANGFYEATATLDVDGIDEAKIQDGIDFESMAKDIKKIIEERSTSNFLHAAYEMLQNVNDVLPAYGVKTYWTQLAENPADQIKHWIRSDYNLTATAIHPLSFATLKDLETEEFSFPLFETIEEMTGELLTRLELSLPQLDKVKFVKLKFVSNPTGWSSLVGDTRVELTYTVEDGPEKTISMVINTGMTEAELAEFTAAFGTYEHTEAGNVWTSNGALIQLMNALNSGNELSISSTISANIENVVSDWVINYSNQLKRAIRSTNKTLQPILLVQANDKLARVNGVAKLPTWIATGNDLEVELTPTSWTLEFFAPAYKKFIAVTNVFENVLNESHEYNAISNGHVDQSLADEANAGENMKKVIDGKTTVKFTGKPGYIYEISYSAVDFYGLVTTRRFYLGFYDPSIVQ